MKNAIYIGKYAEGSKISPDGVIELPDSNLKIIRSYIVTSPPDTADALAQTIEDKIILILQDGNFWPVICKLSEEEAKKLTSALEEAINHKTNPNSKPGDDDFVQFNKKV